MLKLIALSAGMAAMALPSWAEGPTVRLDHVAARVVIIPEARSNITAEVTAGKTLPRPTLQVSGAELTVSGGIPKQRLHSCHVTDHGHAVNLGFWSHTREEDLPQVRLHVPEDVTVIVNGAVLGQIGSLHSLRFTQQGCGGWHVGDVSERFALELQGTADVDAGSVGEANLDLEGLGDVHVHSTKGLTTRMQGLGDVRIDDVEGPVDASVEGMGDLKIKGGHCTSFHARLDGMGDITFGGVAETVDASAEGLGSIRVAKATGEVHKSSTGLSHVSVGQ